MNYDFPCNNEFIKYDKPTQTIAFTIQNGPIKEVGVNGCQIDNVIEFARSFIGAMNEHFPCRENSLTLTKLDEALLWLGARKANREKRGVEGMNVA